MSAHSEAGWIDSRRKANMFDGRRRRRRQIFYLPLFPLLFMGPRDFFPLSHFLRLLPPSFVGGINNTVAPLSVPNTCALFWKACSDVRSF